MQADRPNPFVRASCGCVVAPLGYPSGPPDCEAVILLWSCDGRNDDPYSFHCKVMESAKLDGGRPLTPSETSELAAQLSKRLAMGTQMQYISGAVQLALELNQGRTDLSPARE